MTVKQILKERILMEIEGLPERQLQEMLNFTENLLSREKEVQSLGTRNEKDSFYNPLIKSTGRIACNSMIRGIDKKPSMFSRIILIADEDYRIRNLIRLMFTEHMGYIVVDTSSGVDAILKAKMIKPDIVFAAVSLTDKDGYDISKEIKNDLLLKNTRVILLTSAFDPFNEKKILESHVDDILVKPFEPEETIKKVESLLSQPERKEIRSDLGLRAEKYYREEGPVLFKVFSEAMRGPGKYMDFDLLNPIRLSVANDFRKLYQLQKCSVEDFKTVITQIKDKKILNCKLIKSELFTKDIKESYKILNYYAQCLKTMVLKLKGKYFLSNTTLKIIRPLRDSSPRLDIRPSFAQLVFFILSMGLGMVLLITTFFGFTSHKERAIFIGGTKKEVSFLETDNIRYEKRLNLGPEEAIVKEAGNGLSKLKSKLRKTIKRENYIIKEGDTLWKISRRFNISVKDLKTINKMKDDEIYAGDVVAIPLLKTR